MLRFNEFTDFNALIQDVIQRWLHLVNQPQAQHAPTFALAGGTTPAPLYRHFSAQLAQQFNASTQQPIQLLATDERWVEDANPQSNEGLFKQCFADSAAAWRLISLKNEHPNPTEGRAEIEQRLVTTCPAPFSAVILGMGTDGHIASLFPDAPQLLVDDVSRTCEPALHPQTGQARMSLSFSRLLNADKIWLVITGDAKRQVLHAASSQAADNLPISALLKAARSDVEVFWCP